MEFIDARKEQNKVKLTVRSIFVLWFPWQQDQALCLAPLESLPTD